MMTKPGSIDPTYTFLGVEYKGLHACYTSIAPVQAALDTMLCVL